jgi:hypothetical protein
MRGLVTAGRWFGWNGTACLDDERDPDRATHRCFADHHRAATTPGCTDGIGGTACSCSVADGHPVTATNPSSIWPLRDYAAARLALANFFVICRRALIDSPGPIPAPWPSTDPQRRSGTRFASRTLVRHAPTHGTGLRRGAGAGLLHFRHLLEEHRLGERLLAAQNEIFEQEGWIMRGGSIVDATIVAAPFSTKNATGERDHRAAPHG